MSESRVGGRSAHRNHSLSLTARVVLATNVLLVSAVVLGGTLTWRVTAAAMSEEMTAAGRRTVAAFADFNRLDFLDDVSGRRNIQLRLKSLLDGDTGKTINSAYVFDRAGELLAGEAVPEYLDPKTFTELSVSSDQGELIIGTPVVYDETTLGYVVILFNQSAIDLASEQILRRSMLVLGGSLLLNLVILFFLLKRMLAPLGRLRSAAREFALGNYGHRIVGRLRHDEVGEAARSFNAMCDELETHLRFSNVALVDRIRSGVATDEGQEHQLSVIFCDAVGYTRWSQQHQPAEIFATLRRYYKCIGELMVNRFDGVIDKFIGDGVMAHFGLRRSPDGGAFGHVRQAVCAAIYSQVALRGVSLALVEQGRQPLTYRFGIASGRCLVGAIGAEGILLDFSLIGNVVNLASRIEGFATPGGLLIDRFTMVDVDDELLDVVDRGTHSFKGISEPIRISAVRGFASRESTEEMQRYLLDEFFAAGKFENLLRVGSVDAATWRRIEQRVRAEIEERPYLPVADEAPPVS